MNWWDRHGNTVLTVIEFIGFVGTVTTTAMAAPKIKQKLDCRRRKKIVKQELAPGVSTEYVEDLEFKENAVEIARCVFPECLTPLIFGTVTVLAMVGCKKQYSNQAELAAAYTVGKRLYDEHKEKIHKVMDDINPFESNDSLYFDNVEESKNGKPENRNDIFFLEYSGRRFKSNLKDVEDALEIANDEFFDMGTLLWNELYLVLGIAESKLGSYMGFLDSERMDNPNLPKNDRGPLYWQIRKVTCGEGISALESEKMQENGKFIYMISFGNVPDDVTWYRDLDAWDEAYELKLSL